MSEITSASTIVQTLDAGSGIDIKNLAQSLADAENAAIKARISSKIEEKGDEKSRKSQHRGTLKYTVTCLTLNWSL